MSGSPDKKSETCAPPPAAPQTSSGTLKLNPELNAAQKATGSADGSRCSSRNLLIRPRGAGSFVTNEEDDRDTTAQWSRMSLAGSDEDSGMSDVDSNAATPNLMFDFEKNRLDDDSDLPETGFFTFFDLILQHLMIQG